MKTLATPCRGRVHDTSTTPLRRGRGGPRLADHRRSLLREPCSRRLGGRRTQPRPHGGGARLELRRRLSPLQMLNSSPPHYPPLLSTPLLWQALWTARTRLPSTVSAATPSASCVTTCSPHRRSRPAGPRRPLEPAAAKEDRGFALVARQRPLCLRRPFLACGSQRCW